MTPFPSFTACSVVFGDNTAVLEHFYRIVDQLLGFVWIFERHCMVRTG